ncbi:MAG: S9 family peptidase [Candidatus Marinimicrobia bacterium]|nr:S9 family peptidase [Candidatus Neomarinimicrobiota bacterium]
MTDRSVKIEDLYRFKLVSDPHLSQDGEQVAFVVERMHKTDKTYYRNLFIINSIGKNLRQLTYGKRHDHTPRWSPDGKTLAFISKRDTGYGQAPSDQIWMLPMAGGEAYPLTKLKRGSIASLEWSPDGKTLAFLFHPLGKEIKIDQKGKAETPVYRQIKDIWFRLDGEGFFDSEFTHLWVANTKTGQAQQLVEGAYHDLSIAWSPDSSELAFISFRQPDWQIRLEEQKIYTVPVNGGEIDEIPTPKGPKDGLSFSPVGNALAYFGHERPYQGWGVVNYVLNTIKRNGENHSSFGSELDRTAYPITLGDITPAFILDPPIWTADGKSIYYRITKNGGQPLVITNLTTGKTSFVTQPDIVTITGSLDTINNRYIFHGASLNAPDELYVLDLSTGGMRQLTRLNQAYCRSRDFTVAEEIEFNSGDQKLQGWLVKPPDFDEQKKYPLILNIHGGPRCQYGRTFFHEMYVLAAAGYVVVYTNPRGSQGYGEEFAGTIAAQWGEPAMADLMAAVDYVVARGFVDENRLGVTGGSYGGYMTNWIVTHSDRFKAAATQRCVSDLASMFGNSDIGYDMAYEFGGAPWENRAVYREWSPITHIENCHTPLLIIHSENDLRCNIEQGDQMFTALKYLQREVEYVRFPEEPHGLSRHGRPDRRERRLRFLIEWFDRHLK